MWILFNSFTFPPTLFKNFSCYFFHVIFNTFVTGSWIFCEQLQVQTYFPDLSFWVYHFSGLCFVFRVLIVLIFQCFFSAWVQLWYKFKPFLNFFFKFICFAPLLSADFSLLLFLHLSKKDFKICIYKSCKLLLLQGWLVTSLALKRLKKNCSLYLKKKVFCVKYF